LTHVYEDEQEGFKGKAFPRMRGASKVLKI
jgi:hypothetical protein